MHEHKLEKNVKTQKKVSILADNAAAGFGRTKIQSGCKFPPPSFPILMHNLELLSNQTRHLLPFASVSNTMFELNFIM